MTPDAGDIEARLNYGGGLTSQEYAENVCIIAAAIRAAVAEEREACEHACVPSMEAAKAIAWRTFFPEDARNCK